MGNYQLRRCRECDKLYDPVYDTDKLCNSCFRLEDGYDGSEEKE